MDGGDDAIDPCRSNADPEAIARDIVTAEAQYETSRSLPFGDPGRVDASMRAMSAAFVGAPTLAAAYLELHAEIARLRAEVERLTTRERDAETLFQEMGIKFTDWTRVNTWLAGHKP